MNPDLVHPDHANQEPESARPEAAGGAGRSSAAPPPEVGAVLEAVCRSLTELARATPKPPRRIRMQDGQTRVEVEWPDPFHAEAPHAPAVDASVAGGKSDTPATDPMEPSSCVRAPMVGTFYHAADPDSPPFVRVGDMVQQGQQVGVLEAMKIMNCITAEAGGRVVEMVAANAQRVEFDEPLIVLEPVAAVDDGV